MKKLLPVLILLVFTAMSVVMYAQTVINILYLKNGSVIKCNVLEMEIDKQIKIETADGSVFVYPMSDVLKIGKNMTLQSNASQSARSVEETITDIDGNVYRIREINGLTWMIDNLKTKHYADGTKISSGITTSFTPYLYYPNDEYIDKYGLLYNWAAAVRLDNSEQIKYFNGHRQGVCPEGWHMPTANEFREAFPILAKKVQKKKEWAEQVEEIRSDSMFSVKSAGGFNLPYPGSKNKYNKIGEVSLFWTCTQLPHEIGSMIRERFYAEAFYCIPLDMYTSAPLLPTHKYTAISVRCIKDY
ncbi:FISUMP domain-containing protein [Culturomica massiliensis]|uniref:FISUMP domain-containing protein n=1 Tax=Culturomica massiliensis TaxID=1841857 RepID=UPI0026660BC6|nr:FISUMP domain-containing protein [Culturomica massiliensis]